jgi:signal transduction histidine kinase
MIQADPTQLRQVIMNLVTNAQDALGEDSKLISIRTGTMEASEEWLSHTVGGDDLASGHYVYLEVEDSGGGMDYETRSRIFDPFFTTKGTGRGLGLAALLGIVRSHGGGLRLDTAVGRGSKFRLVFPLPELS